jgi:hypothetical protein
MQLKEQLLASIENHGTCDLSGIYALYPHYRKTTILRALFQLQAEGWVRLKRFRTENYDKIEVLNVCRTRKKLYRQLELM